MPRWVPYLLAVLSLALVPGIARVFASAPPLHLAMHWRLAWGGFDVALLGGQRRRSIRPGPGGRSPPPGFR